MGILSTPQPTEVMNIHYKYSKDSWVGQLINDSAEES